MLQVGRKAEEAKAALEAELSAGIRVFLVPEVGAPLPLAPPCWPQALQPVAASRTAITMACL